MGSSVVNWQQTLTEHQVHTWRGASEILDGKLLVVCLNRVRLERLSQGWKQPSFDGLNVVQSCSILRGLGIVRTEGRAHHIFNTMWGSWQTFVVFLYALSIGRRVSIMSEPYSPAPVGYLKNEARFVGMCKVLLRRVCYTVAGILWGKRVDAVFAISPLAVRQFRACGFRKVLPFGYFIPLALADARRPNRSGALRCVYIGALVERKGVDIAISAVTSLCKDGTEITLDIFGAGKPPSLNKVEASCISYRGVIPFGDTSKILADYDLLLVPSRYDGWGVVVNESVAARVPIVASKGAGASAVVEHFGIGFVYDTKRELPHLLKTISDNRRLLSDWHTHMDACAAMLQPSEAARYLVAALRGNAKESNWYRAQ